MKDDFQSLYNAMSDIRMKYTKLVGGGYNRNTYEHPADLIDGFIKDLDKIGNEVHKLEEAKNKEELFDKFVEENPEGLVDVLKEWASDTGDKY